MKRDNVEMFLASKQSSQEEPPIQGVYRERRIELAKDLFRILEITREDKEKRKEWATRGYRYFDAPVAIILTVDKELLRGTWALLSIGSLMQTICLASLEQGLGTCISEQGATYHSVLREHLHIPEEESVIISIALGYPDPDFLPNQYKCPRASLDEVSHWNGF